MFTKVKTAQEIKCMRESGRMLATVLALLRGSIVPGMSTGDLDAIAAREVKRLGGKPAFLGYEGFPNVLCISVNEEVVHGIPRADHILRDGDVVGLDFGVNYKGMITDAAISVVVGDADKKIQKLVATTEAAMYAAIDTVKHGVRTGDIGAAAQAVMQKGGYGIVRDLVGHGVGHEVHEEPNIPNYGYSGRGEVLKAGMTIAIEPMATLGGDAVYIANDGWTVCTTDGAWAAHFEHTVLITDTGYEILTQL